MKTLANCTPTEFLKQTSLIRKSVSKWLKDTDIMNIRARMPELTKITDDMSDEERKAVFKANKEAVTKQSMENLNAMLDAMIDQYPEETLEIMALVCFVDPKHVDDYPMKEYLKSVTEIMTDDAVLSFFTSLAQLGKSNILKA